MTRTRTLLAAHGDVNDVHTRSGVAYHLFKAGGNGQLFDEGLPLTMTGPATKSHRYAWNIRSLISGRGWGGFQYSAESLERLWTPVRCNISGCRILNCFQLFPPSVVSDKSITLWYFLDQTLTQLFDAYNVRDRIGPWLAENAVEREREGYLRAAGVMMNSRWAAESVIHHYGIPAEKVAVVVPGANVDAEAYECWAEGHKINQQGPAATPLRLVFVGKDPIRKGLDRLLRSFVLAQAQGSDCTLRIIGCPPERVDPELRRISGVEWFGFVDKRHDSRRYLEAVGDCDVGCLLSRAEAGGIGLREYHALGLAVIAPDVGGSPDHVLPEASRLIPPDATDQEIADLIRSLDRDRPEVQRMRSISWQRRMEVSWQTTVRRLGEIMEMSA